MERIGRALNRMTAKWRNEPCPIDVVVEDVGLDLTAYGVDGRLISTPGHTAGSLSVVLGDGTVLVGDLVRGKPGKLSLGMFCEDRVASLDSLEAVVALAPRVVHMSHGTSVGVAELESFIASARKVK